MKDINDVYKKLKKEYPNLKITYTDGYTILIEIKDYKIEAYEETVNFFKKSKCITHTHSDYDYNKLYNKIVYYIDNRNKIKRQVLIGKVDTFLILLVFALLVLLIKWIFKL